MTAEEAADIAREVLGDRAAEVLAEEGGLHVTFALDASDYEDERGAEVELEAIEEAVVALEEACAREPSLRRMKIVASFTVRE